MLNTQFPPWPSYTKDEVEAVSRTLLSNKVNYWTGKECREFEKEFSSWVGVEYSIALANGTLALDLSLRAIGIGEKDEVIVTPRTFIASVSCVVNCGATPVFADIDLNSQNIEASKIKEVITEKTKAIIVVHLAGMPADMDPIMKLADEQGLFVIEDCAQAHGAKYKGKSVGSIGHIGAWSFCQDKIMTTGGEGGMVTTSDKQLWSNMWSYKDHGKSWDAVFHRSHPEGFRWLHESFGTNYRMTEMQAAIGRIQLKKMDSWSDQRRIHAALIDEAVAQFELIRTVDVSDERIHARYKHYVFVEPLRLAEGWTRDRIVNEISQLGVPCYQGSCSEVYLEKAFDNTPYRPLERLANAKQLGETSIMFLVHPTLTKEDMKRACQVIQAVLTKAQKR